MTPRERISDEARKRASRDRIVVLHAEFVQKPPTRKAAAQAYSAVELTLAAVAGLEAQLAEKRAQLPKLVERLIVTHGDGPIQIGGVTYDFGCYDGRVFLRPRRRKARR